MRAESSCSQAAFSGALCVISGITLNSSLRAQRQTLIHRCVCERALLVNDNRRSPAQRNCSRIYNSRVHCKVSDAFFRLKTKRLLTFGPKHYWAFVLILWIKKIVWVRKITYSHFSLSLSVILWTLDYTIWFPKKLFL